MPRFSVLLPTLNRADVVGFAIRSVLGQTDGDFELLIAGDGCTDETAAVVGSFSDRRIRWFDLPKAPAYGYANRNVAMAEATGTFVAHIAHDDLLLPDHLEILGKSLEQGAADWTFSRPVWVSMGGVAVAYPLTFTHPQELRSYMSEGNPIPLSCVGYRRSWLDRCGGWPEDVARSADWMLWKRMLTAGAVVASCREATTLHFVANWRRAIGVGQPEAQALLERAREPWWPGVLKLPLRPEETEQAAAFRQLSEGGLEWCRSFRHALDIVGDRLAWEQINELRNRASRRSLLDRVSGRIIRTVTSALPR